MNTLLTLLFTLLAIPSSYRMMVISDPHVLDQSLFNVNSASMQAKMANDINQSQYAQAAFNQLIDQALKEKPDVVLIPGDLTDNGSKVDHLSVANQLRRLKDAGIPVCLIPGDHDIYNHLAASYLGAEAQPIANIDDAEFDSIYAFLNESWPSRRQDPNSHSYVVTIAPRLTLIGADCTHGYADNEAVGEFYTPTLKWILQQADSAKAKGDRVIAMMHYQLLEHFDDKGTLLADAMVDNYDNIAQAFYAYGIDLVLTGHMHINNVTTKYMSEDLSKSIVEIATGSPILYPNPYRMITASDTWSKFACETRYITSLSGYSDFSSANNKSRLETYLRYTMIPQYIEKLWAEWVVTGKLEALVQAQDFSSLPEFIREKKSDVITLLHDVAAKYSTPSSRAELVDDYASGDLVKSAIIHIDGNEGNQNTSDLKSNLKTDCYNMVRNAIKTTYSPGSYIWDKYYSEQKSWLLVLDIGYSILKDNDNLNNALDGFFGDYTRYKKSDQNRTDDLAPTLQFAQLRPRDYYATVTFDLMGYGSNFVQKVLINDPAKITRPDDPTADGMYFVNWYSDPELTQLYDFNTLISADDDVAITLYAKFIPVITFTLGDVKKIYDGAPIAPLYKYKGSLPKNCIEQVEVDTIITNVDSVTYRVSKTTIWNGDKDVTADYKIEWSHDAASMVITPRSIAITTGSASGIYNGVSLTSNDTTMSGDGFVTGQGIDITYTGTQMYVGNSDNTITYTAQEGTNIDNYTINVTPGKLTITPAALSIALRDTTKMYDGQPMNVTYDVVGTLINDDELLLTIDNESITDADAQEAVITNVQIINAAQEDHTVQYAIVITDSVATLEVTQRSVEITTASATKIYDGTPLTMDSLTITGDGFVEGEGIDITFTGSQTYVGTSDNTIEYQAQEGTTLGNYVITVVPGQLEVTKREISINMGKDTLKMYDGMPLEATYAVTGELAEGDKLTVTVENSTLTNAGSVTAKITYLLIVNATEENVTNQYTITSNAITQALEISKRTIEITTASDEKVWDDTELVAMDTTMAGDGFVDGEGINILSWGSQIVVGWSENEITYEAMEDTDLNNYDISVIPGILSVTEATLPTSVDESEKTNAVVEKVIKNNQLFMIINGVWYDALGRPIR